MSHDAQPPHQHQGHPQGQHLGQHQGHGAELPYKLACLCDLRDESGRVLLIHRERQPNYGLCSPIGGKLDTLTGESPARCAQREIAEEAGIEVPLDRIELRGLISERAFEGRGHWLLFYYRVLGPVRVEERAIPEGTLKWHRPEEIDRLQLPETDRRIIWPLIRAHGDRPGRGGGLFTVHIDCSGPEMTWQVQQIPTPE